MILIDTSVWIDFFRNKTANTILHRLIEEEADLCITEIILTEILQGIKEDRELQIVKDHLMTFPIYTPKGIETYIAAAQIYRNCRKQGKTIRKTIDCIIAAICIENNLTLLHCDSDFNHIQECTTLNIFKGFNG